MAGEKMITEICQKLKKWKGEDFEWGLVGGLAGGLVG